MTGFGMQWNQLDYMQTICTLLQTDNHNDTTSFSFTGRMLFLLPSQQCQSIEGCCIVSAVQAVCNGSLAQSTTASAGWQVTPAFHVYNVTF